MGKFAGFLKRAKNFAHNALHKVVKGATAFKKFMRTNFVEPGVQTLNKVMPIITPVSEGLLKLDDQIIKGMDWLTNKTEPSKDLKQTEQKEYHPYITKYINKGTPTSRASNYETMREMLRNNDSRAVTTRPEQRILMKGVNREWNTANYQNEGKSVGYN